jgi:hypothetical protein
METHILSLAFNDKEDKIITDHPQVHGALATADGLSKKLADLSAISIHEQRICGQHAQALKQLKDAQADRKLKEEKAFHEAANSSTTYTKKTTRSPRPPSTIPRKMASFSQLLKSTVSSAAKSACRRSLDCESRRFQTGGTIFSV